MRISNAIDNQKFLFEHFQILSNTVNLVAKSQTGVKTRTNSSSQTSNVASTPPRPPVNPTVTPPRFDFSTPPPMYSFPPPPPPRPPTPPPPSPRPSMPSDLPAPARPIPSKPFLGAAPPRRRSLLGPPPSLTRVPSQPQPLSVFFCNFHGRPRKLDKKVPPPVKTKEVKKTYSTKIFSNLIKDFTECHTEYIRSHYRSVSTRMIVSEILTDIIDDLTKAAPDTTENSNLAKNTENHTDENSDEPNTETVTNTPKNVPGGTTKQSDLPEKGSSETVILEDTEILLNESVISLDSSLITNSLGDPTLSLHEQSSSHLNLNG